MEIVLSSLVVPNVPNPVSYCMRDIVTIGETEVLNNYSPLRRESAEEIRNAEIENILQQRPRTRKQSAQLMKKQTDGSSSSATVNSKSASVLPSQDETIIKTRSNKKQKGRKAAKYERPARTKKQRLMSSYQVFMQFIKTVNDVSIPIFFATLLVSDVAIFRNQMGGTSSVAIALLSGRKHVITSCCIQKRVSVEP